MHRGCFHGDALPSWARPQAEWGCPLLQQPMGDANSSFVPEAWTGLADGPHSRGSGRGLGLARLLQLRWTGPRGSPAPARTGLEENTFAMLHLRDSLLN